MSKPFDATLKDLVQARPHDWLAVLGEPADGPVAVLTPDLSTVTAAVDVVLRLRDVLFHLDFQSGPDPDLARRLLLYNALLHERYGLPVHSAVLLLRPRADRGDFTGAVSYAARPGRGRLEFQAEVVRLWQVPVERLLAGGPGTLPLATLGRLPEGVAPAEALPAVVGRLAARVEAEVAPAEAATLLTAAFVLAGLRLSREQVIELFRGVRAMRESTAYQAILDEGRAKGREEGREEGRVVGREEGRAEEARGVLFRLGRRRFGPPDEAVTTALQAVTDVARLERMLDRVLDVAGWQEVLHTP